MIETIFANALMCMALNIYHEARNESTMGQLAGGQVVMNRVYDDTLLKTEASLAGTAMDCLIRHAIKNLL